VTTKTQTPQNEASSPATQTSASGKASSTNGRSRHSDPDPGPASNMKLFWIAFASAVAAILDHAYLLNEHYTLRFGETSSKSLCNINELFSCAAASASKYSEFLGIPMALWGIAANLVIVLLLLWHPFTEGDKKSASRRNLLIVSAVIALTSIVMASISIFLVAHLCPFCLLAYLLSFITFAGLWFALPKSVPTLSPTPNSSRNSSLDLAIIIKQFSPVLILAAMAFVAVFIADDQIKNSFGARDLKPMIQESVQSWITNPQLSITPVAALVMGATGDKAKMVITEFADFRCSHCKQAAPILKAFTNAHSDVQLQFEAWPLDGECNSTFPSSNGASCMLARAVNCVELISKKGWAAHEWIYENQQRFVSADSVKGALPEIAGASSVPTEQLATCVASPEAKQLIQNEANVGTQLNLNGTPSIFVNGKKLPAGQFLPVLAEVYRQITSP